jgi:DNA-directed RNA polymerase subunit L
MFAEYVEAGPSLLGDKSHKLQGTFRLENTDVTIANTLRRAFETLTPSIGFRTEPFDSSDVEIVTNTGPLVNDMLAHRVGMIPVRADPLTFDPDTYSFVLDVENAGTEDLPVHASDFKVFKKDPDSGESVQVSTEEFFPPDPITGDTNLITLLRPQWNPTAPKERLFLKAKASLSTGAENMRYSPVAQASYFYTLDHDETKIAEVKEAWLLNNKKTRMMASLPDEAAIVEAKKARYQIWEEMDEPKKASLDAEFKTMEIQRCYVKDERGDPSSYSFTVESVGVQPVGLIVKMGIAACESLVTKYVDVDHQLPPNVRVQQGDSRFPTIDIIFQNESHTLGNLLETHICKYFVEDEGAEIKLNYVGYSIPHPLKPEMVLRLGPSNVEDLDSQIQTARAVLARACRDLKEFFRALQLQWVQHVEGLPPSEPKAVE